MVKKLLLLLIALAMAIVSQAQSAAPQLEFMLELKVRVAQGYSVGKTVAGDRFVIPIIGGTFEGPEIKGEVLSGGADYQLINTDKGRTDLEAIYCIRTDDGVNIHVRNRGLIAGDYFYCSPQFEAPLDSKYAWINNNIYVCRPTGFGEGEIRLGVWRVCDGSAPDK